MSKIGFPKTEWVMLTIGVIGLVSAWTVVTRRIPVAFQEAKVPTEQFSFATTVHGSPNATWRVVEFMDYECAPCKQVDAIAEDACKQLPSKLQWNVMMFPLTMHRHASELAAVALVAKQKGCMAALHKVLFEHQFDRIEKRMQLAAQVINVSPVWLSTHAATITSGELKTEMLIAKSLNVDATPTMFLISPQGQVWAVHNPNEIVKFVKGNTKA